jgi:hypothetical protein
VACTPAAAPARLVEVVLTFPAAAGAVPAAVVYLASGVTDMSRTKLLAAAVLVAGGLAAGTWARLVPTAGAQAPPQNPPAGKVEHLGEGALLSLAVKIGSAPAWEFKYYAPKAPLSLAAIEQAAATYAADGWEYAGAVKLTNVTDERKRIVMADSNMQLAAGPLLLDVLVFKRPARARNTAVQAGELLLEKLDETPGRNLRAAELLAQVAKDPANQPNVPPAAVRLVQMRKLEAEIAAMQQKLDALRKAEKKTAVLTAKDLGAGTDLQQVMTALAALADARYGADGRRQRLSFSVGKVDPPKNETTGLTIEGDPDAVDWLVEVAKKLKPSGPAK